MATVATHLAALRRLLHDPNDNYWSEADKIAYISQAVQRRDLDSGANRTTYTLALTASDDSYTYTEIGSARIFDIISANLIFGNRRIVMSELTFTELNAQIRQFSSYNSYPIAWARSGVQTVTIAPAPASAFSTEWYCSIFSADLTLTAESDPLPYPYTEPVPFYAAYLAKINERMTDEADAFLMAYNQQLNLAVGARAGMLPNVYSSGIR